MRKLSASDLHGGKRYAASEPGQDNNIVGGIRRLFTDIEFV